MTFDFPGLESKMEAAARKAFTEICNAHAAEEIYAFALYSDEGAMTVCPAANTLKHLVQQDQADLPYYKFEPAEWKYEMEGADSEFDDISDALRTEVLKDHADEEWFPSFREQLFTSCITVLEKLKEENFFHSVAGRDIFLTFSVSGYDFPQNDLAEIISRLNTPAYSAEYLQWMKTWAR